tara:strand:+ start:1847 stop:2578 length:732 start_codon:yes stop_codon:yes gene_type:complete
MSTRNILLGILAIVIVLFFATGSHNAYAARCDGNQGNGNGNICQPATQSPHTTQTNRQYIERVHGYAHGNSLGIQALRRTTNAIEAVNVRQDVDIAGKVDTSVFVVDQARQDAAVDALNQQAADISNTLNVHGDVLGDHQAQIDALGSRMSGEVANAVNVANEAHRQAKIAQDQAVASLAVAGHSYDHSHYGLQTAVSAASFGGSTALAVGFGGKVSDRVFLNGAFTNAGSATGGVVSSTLAW